MFLRPEVASVGLNETKSKEMKVTYRVGDLDNKLVSRNVAMRATNRLVKILAARDSRD